MTRLVAALQGRLRQELDREVADIKPAIKRALAEEGDRVKRKVRSALQPAFKGRGRRILTAYRQFPKTLGVYDDGGLRMATVIGPKGSAGRYLEPHFTGATIKPRNGEFLILRVGKQHGERLFANEIFRQPNIAIVPGKKGIAAVIQKSPSGRGRGKLLAVLVKQVKFKKRVDVNAITAQATVRLSRGIVTAVNGG